MGVDPKFEYEAENCIQLSPEEEERRTNAEYDSELESEEVRSEWCPAWAVWPSPKYINAYCVTQAYGGPEEGGWWFDRGEPLESVRCDTQQQFDAATLVVEWRYKVKDCDKWSRERKAGPHSCMRGAYSISVSVEDHFAEAYPRTRPHYE